MALAAAVLLRAFVFTLVEVKGSSMRETLQNGDRLLATKIELALKPPRRGRVMLCRYPGSKKIYVKRLVGLPGDSIEIRNAVTYVNGGALREEYITHPAVRDYGPIKLDADQYFVMGDNRACSRDSRVVGPLHRRQLLGTVRFRIWPLARFGRICARDD